MLPKLRFFVGKALLGMWRSRGLSALTVLTIAVALALLAAFGLAIEGLETAATALGEEIALSAFLDSEVDETARTALVEQVRQWPEVLEARYISSKEGMAEFRTSLGEEASILDGLPDDLIPPSLELHLAKRVWTNEEVKAVVGRVAALPKVEDVRYGQDDFERITAMLDLVRKAALIVGIAVSLAIVLLIFNTIRLAVYSRRDEIEILSLIGATSGFVRAPFVVEGAVQGFLGGLLATLWLWTVKESVIASLGQSLDTLGPVALHAAPVGLVGGVLVLGIALGLFGSGLAVGRFVRI